MHVIFLWQIATYHQHQLHWSYLVVQPQWDFVQEISWLFPTLWWWLYHHHPCQINWKLLWILENKIIYGIRFVIHWPCNILQYTISRKSSTNILYTRHSDILLVYSLYVYIYSLFTSPHPACGKLTNKLT